MLLFLGLRIGLDSVDDQRTEYSDRNRNDDSEEIAVRQTDLKANMLQAFEDRNQRDREGRQEDIHRHVALGFLQRILLRQDKPLDTHVDEECNDAGSRR